MTAKPPHAAAPEDAAALARELADQLAAIATAPAGVAASGVSWVAGSTDERSHSVPRFVWPRNLLENASRFISPQLPPGARFRSLKAPLLRALPILTRDQTTVNFRIAGSPR